MNRVAVAQEILKIAKELMAMEFDTEEEKKKYQQEHEVRPGTKLTVKKPSSEGDSDPIDSFRTRAWELNIGDKAEKALRSKDISHVPQKLRKHLAPHFDKAVSKFHKPGRQKTLSDWQSEAEQTRGPLQSLMTEAWETNAEKEVVHALNTKDVSHLPKPLKDRLEPYFTKVISQK
jgi:hypothetical protein